VRRIDVTGKRFGLLVVRTMSRSPKRREMLVVCDCDCGVTGFVTESYSVRKGLTTSCGCFHDWMSREGLVHRSHGESAGGWTPEYRAWVNMNTRCHNPNSTRFSSWGGRGITVCDEWRHNFRSFLAHVGRKPSLRHSLDRYPNPDGNYEPGNVRWATASQQALNKRKR
jgi:hypothetical protein